MSNHCVIVVDTIWTGHVPVYHFEICRSFLKKGFRVISITPIPNGDRLEIWNKLDVDLLEKLAFATWKEGLDRYDCRRNLSSLRQLIGPLKRNHELDTITVYFPWLDYTFINRETDPSVFETSLPFSCAE